MQTTADKYARGGALYLDIESRYGTAAANAAWQAAIPSGNITRQGDYVVISGMAVIRVPISAIGGLVTLPEGIAATNFTSGSFQFTNNVDGTTTTAVTVTFTK